MTFLPSSSKAPHRAHLLVQLDERVRGRIKLGGALEERELHHKQVFERLAAGLLNEFACK